MVQKCKISVKLGVRSMLPARGDSFAYNAPCWRRLLTYVGNFSSKYTVKRGLGKLSSLLATKAPFHVARIPLEGRGSRRKLIGTNVVLKTALR